MRKFINKPQDVARETVEGFLAVHGDRFEAIPGTLAVRRRRLRDKVAVVSGGGSGHEPVWLEYIGTGFADAVCQGDVFAAPDPHSIAQAAKAVERGRGILFVYGNYSGDRLNFDLAAELLAEEGHRVRTVRVADDVAAAPPGRARDRRGIAGGYFVAKAAGAAAEAGLPLDVVHDVAARVADATRSMGVASGAGTVPGTGEPTFDLPEGHLEIGMGMHGEAGVRRAAMMTADDTVDEMLERILADRPVPDGDSVSVLVNGLGATTRAELLIIARRARHRLTRLGLTIHTLHLGNYATSQEMHGFSLTVSATPRELREYYDAPAWASFLTGTKEVSGA
ncbi:dihydroxyacetone kinase subunit DhaK [Streptomyces litchfieldiae]|uniref:Dihydroxyacetone kinase subunit DhaK n=1 Tax=Streptomyces litchfieldiae TaxID=3075543 RepID=A0ABU2MLZ4_9ACTN|nr:dihydroxyacetone kinase subunit DhaK [Streptomyces sp. DSM 44938]MDT0341948.1 dihydroxyacetone kinase subunit DhaK [Streptomyces sp. DSM 44938]